MTTSETLLQDYLTPSVKSFWKWLDDGDGVGWQDGKLIAFNEEIAFVMSKLANTGLPRFESLLLLLAATSKSWAVDSREANQLTKLLRSSDDQDVPEPNRLALLQQVLEGLHKVRSLDRDLRTSLEAKASIAAIVFEGQDSHVSSHDAAQIARGFSANFNRAFSRQENARQGGTSKTELLRSLSVLAQGLDQLSPERIRLRLETGLDSLPQPADLESVPEALLSQSSARTVIDELHQSPEHAAIAALSKQLLAITSLPRKLSETHEQELGGYSDIANRGSPDRLLLSELAQDGLTLAVRVAMNEAMYLHREIPPSLPRVRRELVIDSGVHAWGLPRLYAASAALALAANNPTKMPLNVWRGNGSDLTSVDLCSLAGFIEHLSALEAEPHLGRALPALNKKIAHSDEPVEVILLMPSDAFTDTDLKASLRELSAHRLYIATADSDGEFVLREIQTHGERIIRRANLSLESLVQSAASVKFDSDLNQLPAIFRVEPFPLRLPVQVDDKSSWSIGNWGALTVTGDGRLMRWETRDKGAVQMSDQLGKGKVWWAAPDCLAGKTSFVHGSANRSTIYALDIPRRRMSATPIHCSGFRAIISHNGFLFALHADHISEISSQTGETSHRMQLRSDLAWVHGRFFCDRTKKTWFALSHDGHSAKLEPLPRSDQGNRELVYFWDAVGFEGPLALTQNGRVWASSDEGYTRVVVQLPYIHASVEAVNHDGSRIIVTGKPSGFTRRQKLLLTTQPSFEPARSGLLDDRVTALARPESLRKKFHAIGMTEDGNLALRAAKSVFAIGGGSGSRFFRALPVSTRLLGVKSFEVSSLTSDRNYVLSVARWTRGDRAVLDSRGLLHLIPADSDATEISLVLASGELSAWCHDGQVFGREYFMPDDKTPLRKAPAKDEIYQRTISNFLEAIRAEY